MAWKFHSNEYTIQYRTILLCISYEVNVYLRCGFGLEKINGIQLIKWNSNRVYSRKQYKFSIVEEKYTRLWRNVYAFITIISSLWKKIDSMKNRKILKIAQS